MGFPRTSLVLSLAATVLLVSACAPTKRSERDTRREQLRINAEAKRKELAQAAGEYVGVLRHGDLAAQRVSLELVSKDVAQSADGEVDPVTVPTVAGYLKFHFDASTSSEALSFAVEAGDFDRRSGKLTLTASNSVHKNLILTLLRDADGNFSGSWAAPELSETGDAELKRAQSSGGTATLADYPEQSLRGEYEGEAVRDAGGKSYRVVLTLETKPVPPDALALVASARLFLGASNASDDYLGYRFTSVDFKPLGGRLSLRTEAGDLTFSGVITEGTFDGEWLTASGGRMGELELTRGEP